jgi:hypothetical protein
MIQQKAGYPLNYSKGSADAGKDRLAVVASQVCAGCATARAPEVTMSGQSRFVFRTGDELRIAFAPFSVHIAFHEGQRLTVNVVEGENAGFSDTVDYEAIVVRKGSFPGFACSFRRLPTTDRTRATFNTASMMLSSAHGCPALDRLQIFFGKSPVSHSKLRA